MGNDTASVRKARELMELSEERIPLDPKYVEWFADSRKGALSEFSCLQHCALSDHDNIMLR